MNFDCNLDLQHYTDLSCFRTMDPDIPHSKNMDMDTHIAPIVIISCTYILMRNFWVGAKGRI